MRFERWGAVAGLAVFVVALSLTLPLGCGSTRNFADGSQGSNLYYSRCQSCHRAYDPHRKPSSWWEENLDRYVERAHLSEAERDSVMAFVQRVLAR